MQEAIDAEVGELSGATLLANRAPGRRGQAAGQTWSADPALADLAGEPAETTYLHRGCLPLNEALGPDATIEDQDALLAKHDITDLDRLPAFAMTYRDEVGRRGSGPDRDDLPDRLDVVPDWPVTGSIGPLDAFGAPPSWNPQTGRLVLKIENPRAAATLTLTGQFPFAVCNEVVPLDEPTGL